jgi:hypothetical protein
MERELRSKSKGKPSIKSKSEEENQQLILKFSNLTRISGINNKQFVALAVNGHKFQQLQEIYLQYNKITDAGLEALAVNGRKFPRLQIISLGDN